MGLVRRLVFDTYEREVERYGGEAGMDAAERYFWIDSEAIVQLLDPANGIGAPICDGRPPSPASTRCCRTSASTWTPSSG